jgi:hypothetical protein
MSLQIQTHTAAKFRKNTDATGCSHSTPTLLFFVARTLHGHVTSLNRLEPDSKKQIKKSDQRQDRTHSRGSHASVGHARENRSDRGRRAELRSVDALGGSGAE